MFDAFYRVLGTNTEGSGLGLSIVKTLADRLSATVSVHDPVPIVARQRAAHQTARQRLNASASTPPATMAIPVHSRSDGRSPRKAKAKTATSTRLSLSTGATFDASPIFRARK